MGLVKKILLLFAVLVIIFCIICIAAFLLKDRIIISLVNERLSKVFAATVKIESLSWNAMQSSLQVKGLKIYNPVGFPQEELLDLTDIYIEYDLSALLKRELHLSWLELEANQIVVIKDSQGRLNLQELGPRKEADIHAREGRGPENKGWPLRIEVLKLKLGRVVYKDFSVSGKPKVEAYDLRLDRTYKGVTKASQVFDLMIMESLRPTALKGAAIYGMLSVAGSQLLPPVGVAVVLTGKDSAKADFPVSFDAAFQASLKGADELGDIIQSDAARGVVKASIHGTSVSVRLSRGSGNSVSIAVSARRFFLPKPHTAEGLLYQISDRLK